MRAKTETVLRTSQLYKPNEMNHKRIPWRGNPNANKCRNKQTKKREA